MSNGDVHIVTGMDAIVNQDNIKPGIDLKELERQFISGGAIQQKTKDANARLNDELADAAKKLGISFGEFKTETPRAAPARPSKLPTNLTIDGFSSRMSPKREPEPKYEPEDEPVESSDEEPEDEPVESSDDEPEDDDSPRSFGSVRSPTPSGNRFGGDDRPRYGSELASRTMEQERREHIDTVMGNTGVGGGFSFEKEKREDVKCAMLAEIDSLMGSLVEEDIDLTRIPRVDRNSSYDEVEAVLKMLRHKNDHTRYCSFAEEFLLFGAYGLEELFDGKRMWFGRYQPDLTGWHNHVNIKLRRMRHDTGQLVSGVMQDYNIGPGARVLLELLPNMVLYSKMRAQQHHQPGIFSDQEMQQANLNIRNLS
jgi:hypothetical protein